jgi:hypothetical protein
VIGADAFITTNINPAIGLANGTPVICHSLSFSNDKIRQQILQLISGDPETGSNPLPYGSEIVLNEPPTAINVEVKQAHDDKNIISRRRMKQLQILQKNSIDKNKIIIPIIHGQDQGEQKWKTFKFKTSSILAPVSQVSVRQVFPLDLSFAMTIHKAQGRTIPRVVLALSPRPNHFSQLEYAAVFVAMSRVKETYHIRILCTRPNNASNFDPETEFKYLTELKANPYTLQFYSGYTQNNGIWNEDKACMTYYRIN